MPFQIMAEWLLLNKKKSKIGYENSDVHTVYLKVDFLLRQSYSSRCKGISGPLSLCCLLLKTDMSL